jgi:hypothetical protein
MTDADPTAAPPAPPAAFPTVGRVVHHFVTGPDGSLVPRPAVVVEVHSGSELGLSVHTPDGVFFARSTLADQPAEGCWSWPPRA